MGVLFLLRAPGEACGTAKSSFGKGGGRGQVVHARLFIRSLLKMPFRKETFVSFPYGSSSGFDISRDMYPFKCQSCFTTESSHLSFLPGETNRDY